MFPVTVILIYYIIRLLMHYVNAGFYSCRWLSVSEANSNVQLFCIGLQLIIICPYGLIC